jgi:acyl-CoA synthetase (AMP-forming)/AMP-acid ligase II
MARQRRQARLRRKDRRARAAHDGGILNLPELTAECSREGWFQTKDMATVDAAGRSGVVDRQDDPIMSGGLNLYP